MLISYKIVSVTVFEVRQMSRSSISMNKRNRKRAESHSHIVSATGSLRLFLQSLASQLQQQNDAVDAQPRLQLVEMRKNRKDTITTKSQLKLEHPCTILKFNIRPKPFINSKQYFKK